MAQNFSASLPKSLQKSISGQVGAFKHTLKDKIYLIDYILDNSSLLVWNFIFSSANLLSASQRYKYCSTHYYIHFHCIKSKTFTKKRLDVPPPEFFRCLFSVIVLLLSIPCCLKEESEFIFRSVRISTLKFDLALVFWSSLHLNSRECTCSSWSLPNSMQYLPNSLVPTAFMGNYRYSASLNIWCCSLIAAFFLFESSAPVAFFSVAVVYRLWIIPAQSWPELWSVTRKEL